MKLNIKIARNWVASITIVISVGGTMLATALSQTVAAACEDRFLGFPAWYQDLVNTADCSIKSPADVGGIGPFVWTIGLNVLEIALIAVAYISAFFILYGGFLFIVSKGNPESAANARKTMLNAIIGLLISMAAVILVSYVSDGILK